MLTRHGGPDALEYREDIAVPHPGPGQVLIRVAAAGVNNTDINTRTGWYSRSVTAANGLSSASDQVDAGGWSGSPLTFPRIQGADACGSVVAVGEGVPRNRVGERVIIATMQQAPDGKPFETVTLGSEMDGAFAQFLVAAAAETHAVSCGWTDVELASVPCA